MRRDDGSPEWLAATQSPAGRLERLKVVRDELAALKEERLALILSLTRTHSERVIAEASGFTHPRINQLKKAHAASKPEAAGNPRPHGSE